MPPDKIDESDPPYASATVNGPSCAATLRYLWYLGVRLANELGEALDRIDPR